MFTFVLPPRLCGRGHWFSLANEPKIDDNVNDLALIPWHRAALLAEVGDG
jgi:hypothetical protein